MATITLRPWQRDALAMWEQHPRPDFLAVATPGAGKTTFALAAASRAFHAGRVDQLVVVCPSDHLRRQWADAAAAVGMPIDPDFSNADGVTAPQFCGIAVTYAQVASAPDVHASGVSNARTFVILDEIHHTGDDRSWGDALKQAYQPAVHRLALSGTPWRSDSAPIPFVTYERGPDGIVSSRSDYRYGYAEALADKIVRPVLFMAYSGHSRWQDNAGVELAAQLDDPLTPSVMRRAWRTALDPRGEWIEAVLRAAAARLDRVRSEGMPDAGGLVIASNQAHARDYATLLSAITGDHVSIVTSDSPDASDRIDEFSRSRSRWLVAVKMVSEGVDIPRLAVGVYATNIASPLFFAQAIGRVVRARSAGETATVFLPSVPPLLALAAQLEAERNHVLNAPAPADADGLMLLDDDALDAANIERDGGERTSEFKALAASGHLDRVIFDGAEHGGPADAGSAAETSWLTLPGLLEPAELAATVTARAGASMNAAGGTWNQAERDVPLHRKMSSARRELHRLVGAIHHRTKQSHGAIHARLRSTCGGPQAAAASLEELELRIATASDWL